MPLTFKPALCLRCGATFISPDSPFLIVADEAIELDSDNIGFLGGELTCSKCAEKHEYTIQKTTLTLRRATVPREHAGPTETVLVSRSLPTSDKSRADITTLFDAVKTGDMNEVCRWIEGATAEEWLEYLGKGWDEKIGDSLLPHVVSTQIQSGAVPNISELVLCLHDQNPSIRFRAELTLGSVGKPAVASLVPLLAEPSVRRNAAQALYRAMAREGEAYPEPVEPLLAVFQDDDKDFREAIVAALGATRDCRAVGTLLTAMRDTDADVRKAAARALANIQDPRTVEALTTAFEDQDDSVKDEAGSALARVVTRDLGDGPVKNPQITMSQHFDVWFQDGQHVLSMLRDGYRSSINSSGNPAFKTSPIPESMLSSGSRLTSQTQVGKEHLVLSL